MELIKKHISNSSYLSEELWVMVSSTEGAFSEERGSVLVCASSVGGLYINEDNNGSAFVLAVATQLDPPARL